MFKITEGDFKKQKYGDESYLSNWPMLYILENGKQAYIGQSNHVINRMSQHYHSIDKRILIKYISSILRNLINQLRSIMNRNSFSILLRMNYMRSVIKMLGWQIKNITGKRI